MLLPLWKSYPNDTDILEMIGDCEFKSGMIGEALELFINLYKQSLRKDIRSKIKDILMKIKHDEKDVMDIYPSPGHVFVNGLRRHEAWFACFSGDEHSCRNSRG